MSSAEEQEGIQSYIPLTTEGTTPINRKYFRCFVKFLGVGVFIAASVFLLFSVFIYFRPEIVSEHELEPHFWNYGIRNESWINMTCNKDTELEVYGNYIHISDIVGNNVTAAAKMAWPLPCRKESIKRLLVFSTDTIFIDAHIRRDEEAMPNLEFCSLLAPKWALDFDGVVEINLSGRNGTDAPPRPSYLCKDGESAEPGKHGGGFVGIYGEARKKYRQSSILVNVKGGNGGNGGDGENGADGEPGRNATFYDLPPAADAERISIPVEDGRRVNTLSPGSVVRGIVREHGRIFRHEYDDLTLTTEMIWVTAIGYAGGHGEEGGRGGFGGAAGHTGKVTILKIDSTSKHSTSEEIEITVIHGDGRDGTNGHNGKIGRDGTDGNTFSCPAEQTPFPKRISYMVQFCVSNPYTKIIHSHSVDRNVRIQNSTKKAPTIVYLEIPQIVGKFRSQILVSNSIQEDVITGRNFLELLDTSQKLLTFTSPLTFVQDLLANYKYCQNRKNLARSYDFQVCHDNYISLLSRQKMYANLFFRNDTENKLGQRETILFDFLHSLTTVMGPNASASGWAHQNQTLPLPYLEAKQKKLGRLENIFQNIYSRLDKENNSGCLSLLKHIQHPKYGTTFLGRSLEVVKATDVLINFISEASLDVQEMVAIFFPNFIRNSSYGQTLKNYMENPLQNIHDKNCSLLIKFHRLVEELKVSLDEQRFQSWLSNLVNVGDNNVLELIKRYKLADISKDVKEFIDYNDNAKLQLLTVMRNAVPWMNVSCVAGEPLIVEGNFFTLSSVLGSTACQETKVRHVWLFASEIVYLDRNLTKAENIMKNLEEITIIAPKWIIPADTSGNVVMDLSGLNTPSPRLAKASNCNATGKSGTNGEDGLSGGDGGNFFGIYSEIVNSARLFIKVDGGRGGEGQDGGDGCEGVQGKNASEGLYSSCSPLIMDSPHDNMFYQEQMQPDGAFYEGKIGENGRIVHDWAWYTRTGFIGGPGSDGGRGGNAGAGGNPGIAELHQIAAATPNVHVQVNISKLRGANGIPGVGGLGGSEGPRGDNYSCNCKWSDRFFDCYSSRNTRPDFYRRFRNGTAGENGSIADCRINSTISSSTSRQDLKAYIAKFGNLAESRFVFLIAELDTNLQSSSCATSTVVANLFFSKTSFFPNIILISISIKMLLTYY